MLFLKNKRFFWLGAEARYLTSHVLIAQQVIVRYDIFGYKR